MYNVNSASADLTRAGYLIRRSRRAGRVSGASEVIDPIRSDQDPIRRDQDPHAARREIEKLEDLPTSPSKMMLRSGQALQDGPCHRGMVSSLQGRGGGAQSPACLHTYIHTYESFNALHARGSGTA